MVLCLPHAMMRHFPHVNTVKAVREVLDLNAEMYYDVSQKHFTV